MMSDEIVSFYEKYPFPNDKTFIDSLYDYLERIIPFSREEMNVLVIGCGTGEEVIALQNLRPNATIACIEPSIASIIIARRNVQNCKMINKRIEEYETTERYDLILCSGVLHHTKNPRKNLQKIKMLLTTSGKLALGVYHHARWDAPLKENANKSQIMDATQNPRETTYSWYTLLRMIQDIGLEPIKTGHRLPLPTGRISCCFYDALFLYKKQQTIFLLCKKKYNRWNHV